MHWSNLGTVLRAAGRLDEALGAYQRAESLGARGADFLYNVALLHVDRNDLESARVALCEAHRLAPRDAVTACQYASVCCEVADQQSGLAALSQWQSLDGLTTAIIAQIGGLLIKLGAPEQAEAAIARVAVDPNPPVQAVLELVLTLERVNRVEEAERWLARVPGEAAALPGNDTLVLLARARLAQRRADHDSAVTLFRRLIDLRAEPSRSHIHLFPLARSLDALGRYDEAFAAAQAAHDSQSLWTRQTAPEVVEGRGDALCVTRRGCDPTDVQGWDTSGAPGYLQSPIFIVAFPRSGTTLLEQVLDAHPRLRSMDEQPYLQQAIERLCVGEARYPECMAPLTPAHIEEAREHYWRLVDQRVHLAPGEQLVDKNPLNILRLPAIARLFPNARILLAVRHPCDVVMSCFQQHFRNEFAWNCRDLPTLAQAYRLSMDYWYAQAALLRPTVRELPYEGLVREFEAQVRELATFLDLPWVDAMLEPGEHARRKGFISTPSYAQVVQPVHGDAVDRWRAYERHLVPVAAQLGPYLERWGYSAPVDLERSNCVPNTAQCGVKAT